MVKWPSELVPDVFFLVEVNASFRWFSQGSQATLWNLRRITHSLKKKKKTLIRAKNSSADFTNYFVVERSVILFYFILLSCFFFDECLCIFDHTYMFGECQ